MLHFFLWYLILFLFALATLPLGWTWFRFLPDRGWALLRPLGLLLVGFFVWFLGSFGFLQLNAGSGFGSLVLLFAIGAAALFRWGNGKGEGESPPSPIAPSPHSSLAAWLRQHWKIILVEELLFFFAFAFWTWYRIHDGSGISHTEQPMDFAFMNAILRDGEMPPNDPWLSGFAISYYYMGYLIMAQVTALSMVPSGIAYNLALATLAGLASVGGFSLAYNLVVADDLLTSSTSMALFQSKIEPRGQKAKYFAVSLVAVLLLLGISNLTGLLTMTYHNGYLPDGLYEWFGVHDLVPDANGNRAGQTGWWWWKASRTLYDRGADGGRIEVIDEFPFFSFLLGDMHPHVLSLPFIMLTLTIALNGLWGAFASEAMSRWRYAMLPPDAWGRERLFAQFSLLLMAIIFGSLAMLNTWDFPTQGAIIALVWLIAATMTHQDQAGDQNFNLLMSWISGGILLFMTALLLYLPFYVGFRSQAGGIHLSPWSTAPQQYLLMFGLFWLVLLPLVLSQSKAIAQAVRTIGQRTLFISAMMLLTDALLLLALLQFNLAERQLALLMAALWLLIPLGLMTFLNNEEPTPLWITQLALFPMLAGLVTFRWTIALVAVLLTLSLLALWAQVRGQGRALPLQFVLILTAVALLLTMGSDIFYIKDGFPGRMNTIFKLYYQAWVLMAIASTFGLFYLAKRMPLAFTIPWLTLFSLLTLGSMWYPIEALPAKANNFEGAANWDGRFWMMNSDPDRFAAIEWLNARPNQVVLLEKPGGAYNVSESALSGWTGHSTLLGWRNHEGQWRGTYDEIGQRDPVILQIYQTTDPAEAQRLINEWQIDYVAITRQEIDEYNLAGAQIEKFYNFMTPVFEQGSVIIFGR